MNRRRSMARALQLVALQLVALLAVALPATAASIPADAGALTAVGPSSQHPAAPAAALDASAAPAGPTVAGPTVAGAARAEPAVADTPPEPPPVRVAPPAARIPGATPGLRRPTRCNTPLPQEPPDIGELTAQRLQLAEVHRLAQGDGQVVAVIDTGVFAHDRLAGRLRGVADFLTGGDGRTDCDGHGTAVAGLLAASPSPDDDVVGMAPAAALLTIRHSSSVLTVTGADGAARGAGDVDSLAEAVVLAVQQGATVINISETACLHPHRAAREGAVLQAALRLAARRDVVVVAAAGNTGVGGCTGRADAGEVSVPGWYGDDVLTVAATSPDDSPAPFTVPGPWVDVAAPGTGLWSLAVGGGVTGDGVDGTSFAAPWVAGLAALVRQRFPDLTAAQVVDRIVATARRAPGGRDPALGHGIVDPLAALTAEPAVLRPGPTPAAPSAALAGSEPAPPAGPTNSPAPLLAVAALAAAAAAAVSTLRRRPAQGSSAATSAP